MKIRDAAINLYHARNARVAARKALKEYREKVGECEESTELYDRSDKNPDCYRNEGLNRTDWCSICEGSQPLWEAKVKASNKAGAALRVVMALCKQNAI
jgi:hypothetical protein